MKKVMERVKNVPLHTYTPSSKPLISQSDHGMLMRLSYPVTLYGEEGCMSESQFSIIDGIESYIHKYRPRSFAKYLIDKAGVEGYTRSHNPKSYDMRTRFAPDDNGVLSLNDLFTQNQLVREAEIFWDKLDPSCPLITAIFAGALARKLQCDARRQEGQINACISEGKARSELFTDSDAVKISGSEREANIIPIQDLFRLPASEEPVSDSSADLSPEESFAYWMDHNPVALAKALERFSQVSIAHSLNKLYKLVGRDAPFEFPASPNGTLDRTPNAHDFYEFFDIERNKRFDAYIDDKVTVYGMAAMSMAPALMPYAYEFFAGEKHKDLFVSHNLFAYQRYGLYDSNTIYDVMAITGENYKENRLHWESHLYGRNFNTCAQICAVDYLYRRRAMGMQPAYLGDMNRSVNPYEATRHALDFAQRAIMSTLSSGLAADGSFGRIPKETAYPSVAVEETLTQFNLHDPTMLGFLKFDELSNTGKQSYLFLTQPASIRAAQCYLEKDEKKTEEIRNSVIRSVPGLLHEIQKSLFFMPKEVSKLVTGCDYSKAFSQPLREQDLMTYDNYPDL